MGNARLEWPTVCRQSLVTFFPSQEDFAVTNTTKKPDAEKARNYTAEQESHLKGMTSPITYAQACELADEWGKSKQSVISKILSMNLGYEKKPVETKKVSGGPTKAELVQIIENNLDCDGKLTGLEKSTAKALTNLLKAVNALIPA